MYGEVMLQAAHSTAMQMNNHIAPTLTIVSNSNTSDTNNNTRNYSDNQMSTNSRLKVQQHVHLAFYCLSTEQLSFVIATYMWTF